MCHLANVTTLESHQRDQSRERFLRNLEPSTPLNCSLMTSSNQQSDAVVPGRMSRQNSPQVTKKCMCKYLDEYTLAMVNRTGFVVISGLLAMAMGEVTWQTLTWLCGPSQGVQRLNDRLQRIESRVDDMRRELLEMIKMNERNNAIINAVIVNR